MLFYYPITGPQPGSVLLPALSRLLPGVFEEGSLLLTTLLFDDTEEMFSEEVLGVEVVELISFSLLILELISLEEFEEFSREEISVELLDVTLLELLFAEEKLQPTIKTESATAKIKHKNNLFFKNIIKILLIYFNTLYHN